MVIENSGKKKNKQFSKLHVCFGIVSARVHNVILVLGLCNVSKSRKGREEKMKLTALSFSES